MIVTSNLIPTPKVVTIDQNRWSRSVKFTGHDLLEWVVTVDQNTQSFAQLFYFMHLKSCTSNTSAFAAECLTSAMDSIYLASSSARTWRPINPAAPVTATFIIQSALLVRLLQNPHPKL
jgi:hypothetical protein